MSSDLRRLPKDSLVLVTGANGYIASHVVDVLLKEGYRVRGTIRNEKPWLEDFFASKYGQGKFETVILQDMADSPAFDAAAKDTAGIVHVASDLSFDTDVEKVVSTTVAGTMNCLEAAAQNPSIKSVVYTSSSTAALIPEPDKQGVVVEKDTWNEKAVQAARSSQTPAARLPYTIYAASKTEAERALWRWTEEHRPSFAVNSVVPSMNTGRILHPEINGSTMKFVRALLKGDKSPIERTPPQWFVDVRDCALLHVAALLDPGVQSQRLFAFAESLNWTDVVNILRKHRPGNSQIPDPPENEGRDLSVVGPAVEAEALLRSFLGVSGWTSIDDSIRDGIEGLE
ncbi:hypothetical protein H2200_013054 [Cladophialophora chaetospira]|uniref:NAD-dependent epimerase/dehydratase domain-containing protein n=1 Tax=Cladophialophora chaetospira TaxID=386627 RepID=A0AA39CBT3_9EURO|nr:hypothetical protein H2200_013054 [Cladophialophora chaetospira]